MHKVFITRPIPHLSRIDKAISIHYNVDNMIRTQVYFPQDLYNKVKTEAQKKNVSIAEVVRRAVVEKVSTNGSKAKVNPGNWLLKAIENAEKLAKAQKFTGPKYGAAKHDEYLVEAEIASWKR